MTSILSFWLIIFMVVIAGTCSFKYSANWVRLVFCSVVLIRLFLLQQLGLLLVKPLTGGVILRKSSNNWKKKRNFSTISHSNPKQPLFRWYSYSSFSNFHNQYFYLFILFREVLFCFTSLCLDFFFWIFL